MNLNKLSEDFSRIANSTSGLPDIICFYADGIGYVEMYDTAMYVNGNKAGIKEFKLVQEYLERRRDDSKSS